MNALSDALGASAEVAGPAEADRPVVVFADDDPVILAALQGALRRERRHYDLVFVDSAGAALAELDRRRVDVLVTDLSMPDMDGRELLERVRRLHPGTVRYALSGESSSAPILEAMPLVHRWLAKPCDRDTLVDALSSAVRYRRNLVEARIIEAVGGIDALPAVPRLYQQILAVAGDDSADAARIADIAGADPAIAAKILQIANSAAAGVGVVDDLGAAIARLGVAAITRLVLAEEVVRSLEQAPSVPGVSVEVLARHSRRVGDLAADLTVPAESMTARVAGLLHLSGLLVAATRMPDRLVEANRLARERGIDLLSAQAACDGFTHVDIAGHLLSMWGLPTPLVEAVVGAHRAPERFEGRLPAHDAVALARLVVVASGVSGLPAPLRGDAVLAADERLATAVADRLSAGGFA